VCDWWIRSVRCRSEASRRQPLATCTIIVPVGNIPRQTSKGAVTHRGCIPLALLLEAVCGKLLTVWRRPPGPGRASPHAGQRAATVQVAHAQCSCQALVCSPRTTASTNQACCICGGWHTSGGRARLLCVAAEFLIRAAGANTLKSLLCRRA
jgi:hypothetical protein